MRILIGARGPVDNIVGRLENLSCFACNTCEPASTCFCERQSLTLITVSLLWKRVVSSYHCQLPTGTMPKAQMKHSSGIVSEGKHIVRLGSQTNGNTPQCCTVQTPRLFQDKVCRRLPVFVQECLQNNSLKSRKNCGKLLTMDCCIDEFGNERPRRTSSNKSPTQTSRSNSRRGDF